MTECSIEGCLTWVEARGWCQKHYTRWRNHGSPYTVKKYQDRKRVSHPLYTTYRGMIQRCTNDTAKFYPYYGGRGITVCKRWLAVDGFENFVSDMGPRPEGQTLDRRNNMRGYTPGNCRWTDRTTQQLNQRTSRTNSSGHRGVHFYKANGKWSAYIGYKRKRVHLGYFDTIAEAVRARKSAEQQFLNIN
jgi:hypothetical protein